jgi:hypothetical protein
VPILLDGDRSVFLFQTGERRTILNEYAHFMAQVEPEEEVATKAREYFSKQVAIAVGAAAPAKKKPSRARTTATSAKSSAAAADGAPAPKRTKSKAKAAAKS